MNFVQPWLGHDEGHVPDGSHCSPDSITPFPHFGTQSESLVALQFDGQQPSLDTHAVCCLSLTHSAVQMPALTSFRNWQPTAGHTAGQVESGSQVSIPSLTPLSHLTLQSRSFVVSQPEGQQPSSFPAITQVASQVVAEP
jgi:hypothetical protein